MLSLDLFDSKFEKKLHEGALDDTITRTQAHLMEPLSKRAADIRTQIRSGKLSGAELDKLEKEYEDLVQQRQDIIFNRKTKTQEQQVPSKQDPFAYVKPEPKGIGDIQDPRQKMAQLAQRSKKGPLANVGAGIKGFLTGKDEPLDEQQGPRAYGVANFQRLVKANMGGYPTVTLEFSASPDDHIRLDQRGLDLISDYYDGLANDAQKNHFIYRILPSRDETMRVLKKLGWQLNTQQQLPGIPTQAELPLSEKKKSDDIEAGDVKTARELQKIRAQYPAARSDVEALARAEIDSTERSQDQIGRIRSSNSRQDELLKQIMKIDSEQSQEINTLDSEKDSIEAQLDRVQSLNDRLAQAMTQMTGARSAKTTSKTATNTASAPDSRPVIDLIPGASADQQTTAKPVQSAPKPVASPAVAPATSPAMSNMARTITGLSGPAPSIDKDEEPKQVDQEPAKKSGKGPAVPSLKSLRQQQSANVDNFELVAEGQPQELIHRYLAIDAENDVDAVRQAIQAISKDPALGANSKSRLLGQIGMIIRRHRLPIGRSYYQFMQQYMEAVELDRNKVAGYPQDPATVKHRLDTAKAILSDPHSDADSRREAAAIVAKLDKKVVAETVTNVKAGMAEIYRRLAPKIERHRDSFLAGQLYDELENYAELHGAEGEFKRMMATARNSAHMEYDTNPGGFQNWFWFLPFEDNNVTEGTDDIKKRMSKLEALALAANRAGDDAKCKRYQQKIQSLKQKLSQSMNEFDASGYDRYSIYMDDYDLEEKFSDLDDAVEAIEAYKRDDPKSRYADYNVRDLNGKVVWRNDAWQDVQKPGKIQFLPRNDQGVAEATGDDRFDSMMNRIGNDPWTQLNSDPNWEYEIEELVDQQIEPWLLAMERSGMPITRDGKTLNPGWRKRYEQVSTQLAQKYLASKKFNPRDPDLVGKIRAAIDNHTDQSRNVAGQLSAYADDLPMHRYADAFDADGQTANIRDAMAGLAPSDDDNDDGYAPRPRPTANPRRLDPGNMEEAKWDPFTGGDFSATHDMNYLPSDDANADPSKTTAEQFKAMIQYYSNNALVRQALDDLYRVTIGGGYDDSVVRPEKYLATIENQRTGKTEKRYFKSKEDAYRYAKGNNAVITNLEKIDSREDTSDLITLPVLLGLGDHKKKWMLKFPSEDYAQKWEFKHKNAAQIQWPAGHALAENAVDSKSWMAQTRTKYPAAKFMQAKTPGAPIRAYVDGKVVAEFNFSDSKGIAESAKPGEYYVHTVYFKDGTKKRIRVTSDEVDVADYYTKRGKAVDRVDYDFQLHSDMTEAVKEPTTRQELLNRVDKIQRMMTQERNPANLQILRKELEMLKQRYQHLREDNDSEAVEMAIIKRILVAHTDLIMEFGLDKVTQAIEEVAYNVGDVDEIGSSDVSAYVHQVKQILGVPENLHEKWSAKYKSSINCANPKGFSQKAHCAGKKK